MGDYTIIQHILMAVGTVGGLLIIWKAVIPFIGKVFGWMLGKKD